MILVLPPTAVHQSVVVSDADFIMLYHLPAVLVYYTSVYSEECTYNNMDGAAALEIPYHM